MPGIAIDLSGRTALVTGSTSGIGAATAKRLADAGARVIVHGRDRDRVRELVTELKGDARGVTADLSTADGVAGIIQDVKRMGNVDILVNNAGVICGEDIWTVGASRIEQVLRTNAWSGLAIAQAFVREMCERNNCGRVIWISSNAGIMPQSDMSAYGLSKMVMIFLARAMAEATARMGATTVTSTAIAVGPTSTPGADRYLSDASDGDDLGDVWKDLMAAHPHSLLARPMTPQEVADVIVWLASPLSTIVRGSVIRAEGGVIPSPF